MAQLIEEVSVLVADQRRKKPRKMPRPRHITGEPEGIQHAVNVLKSSTRGVRVMA